MKKACKSTITYYRYSVCAYIANRFTSYLTIHVRNTIYKITAVIFKFFCHYLLLFLIKMNYSILLYVYTFVYKYNPNKYSCNVCDTYPNLLYSVYHWNHQLSID